MDKCINGCQDAAESNFSWPTSRGVMSANFCCVCGDAWWNKFKNTPAGLSLVITPTKSKKELAAICSEYAGAYR